MSLLEITQLTHAYGDKILYRNAQIALNRGEHMGIVGANGSGKSTLIGICTGEIIPDDGRVVWQPGIRYGYLDQYAKLDPEERIADLLQSAFVHLYALEEKMNRLYSGCSDAGSDVFREAEACQNRLEAEDFYSIDVRIGKVADGLGLTALGMERKLGELSGGQRAKVILAKLLLEEPEVLLLDEPTNFLDKEHVEWLAQYLAASRKAFMVVSHDFGFLEKTADFIADIDNGEIRRYTGRYSAFLKQKEHLREDYARRYQTQLREIRKTEEFIRKNIAGIKSRNARGRRKQLQRLDRLEAPGAAVRKPVFVFRNLPVTVQEHLLLEGLSIGYEYPLLKQMNLLIRGGERVVITGFNGIGKSTLLKTLAGRIAPLGGSCTFSDTVAAGYYDQDMVWPDEAMTPFRLLSDACPSLDRKQIRQQLSRCGIPDLHVLQPVGTLSGGEQARVKMCLLLRKPYNFLMLDEPTNHLDAASKEALKEGLVNFEGTVVLVSHEEAFYRDWADRVIRIEDML